MRTLLSSSQDLCQSKHLSFSLPGPQFLDCCSSRLGHCTSQQVSLPLLSMVPGSSQRSVENMWLRSFFCPLAVKLLRKRSTYMTNKRMLKLQSFLVTEFNRRASISPSTCWKSPRRHNVILTYNPHDGLVGILSVYKGKNKGSENFIPCPVSLTD